MAKQKSQALPAVEGAVGAAAAADASVTDVTSAAEVAVATANSGDPVAGQDGITAEAAADTSAAGEGGAAVAPGAQAVDEPGQDQGQSQDEQAPMANTLPTAKVRALVLSDNAFGRCGEVREFEAAHAPAIEAGGFIDTHPNAVASAEGD